MSSDGFVEMVWGFTLILCLSVGGWLKLDAMAHRKKSPKFEVNEHGHTVPVIPKRTDWGYVFTVVVIVLSVILVGVISGLFGFIITGLSQGGRNYL